MTNHDNKGLRANEFVREYGLDEARKIVDGYKFAFHPSFEHWSIKHNDYYLVERDYTVAIADLKRLVESYELVESYGGLESAKWWIKTDGLSAKNADFNACIEAIADVGSCL